MVISRMILALPVEFFLPILDSSLIRKFAIHRRQVPWCACGQEIQLHLNHTLLALTRELLRPCSRKLTRRNQSGTLPMKERQCTSIDGSGTSSSARHAMPFPYLNNLYYRNTDCQDRTSLANFMKKSVHSIAGRQNLHQWVMSSSWSELPTAFYGSDSTEKSYVELLEVEVKYAVVKRATRGDAVYLGIEEQAIRGEEIEFRLR